MNDNYNFLGTISAVYDFADADENKYTTFENCYITLTVFNSTKNFDHYLKILYNELAISNGKRSINKGEIVLKDFGKIEYDVINKYFNEVSIKELILAKFLDYQGDHLNFEIVY